jgi:hypothetical protein
MVCVKPQPDFKGITDTMATEQGHPLGVTSTPGPSSARPAIKEMIDGGLLDEPRWAVRAAFDLSHRRLDTEQARLFRLLAAVPGTDTGLSVAAERPQQVVRQRLGRRWLRRRRRR